MLLKEPYKIFLNSLSLKWLLFGTGFRHNGYLILSTLAIIVSCSGDGDIETEFTHISDTDAELRNLIIERGLSGDPAIGRALPSINSPKAQLGKKLFFTKALGGDLDAACVSCHHPALGGGDNLSLSVGVGAVNPDQLGIGRFHSAFSEGYDGGPTVPRNAPSTYNIALWEQHLFWDGRVETLAITTLDNGSESVDIRTPDTDFGQPDVDAGENLAMAQARFPVTSPEEMLGFSFQQGENNATIREALEERLTTQGSWAAEFESVYGDTQITFNRIVNAIAEYENSQVFVSSPWKSYVAGNLAAITPEAKEGALLFFKTQEDSGAGCASCHSGDFFTDEQFYVTAIPQIGRGKGDQNGITTSDDFGRFRETQDINDKYKFRTPTLLNVEVTGPWGHTGAYRSLEGIVKHMLNPHDSVQNYDFSQLDPNVQAEDMKVNTEQALLQLESNRVSNVENVLQNVSISDSEVSALVEFLKSLTDPCVKSRSCLSDWIPGAEDSNPDGLRINAVSHSGEYL